MTRPRRSVAAEAATPVKTEDEPKKTPAKKPPTKAECKENGAAPPTPATNGDTPAAGDSAKDVKDTKTEASKKIKTEKSSKDLVKTEDSKPKKIVKKTVPLWATLNKTQQEALLNKKSGMRAESVPPKQIICDAVEKTGDDKGRATVNAMRKYALKHCPGWNNARFKKVLAKATDSGAIVQVKGDSILRGTFKLGKIKEEPVAKVGQKSKKLSKSRSIAGSTAAVSPTEPLDNLFPNIFTWVCEPKEATFGLIRRYIAQHHKRLDVEGKLFLQAIESAVNRGQLERLTGKGASGTFQLVDGAKKSGGRYEDAIEDAIIAMNEPKDASIPALRHYLSEYHTEYRVADKPKVLLSALERCEAKGWLKRLSGKGFSGSYRLAHPYFPAPKELWGEWYEGDDDDDDEDDEDEDSSEDEEEEEEDLVYVPRKGKRPAPKARKTPLPKKKKAAPAAKKVTPAKKTPAKKAPAGKGRKRR